MARRWDNAVPQREEHELGRCLSGSRPHPLAWSGQAAYRDQRIFFSAEDWVQTLVPAAGEPDIGNKLLQGYSAAGKTFKAHLDGYDQRDLLAGNGPSERREFFYWTDDRGFGRPALRSI